MQIHKRIEDHLNKPVHRLKKIVKAIITTINSKNISMKM